jgi:hypothetical protein
VLVVLVVTAAAVKGESSLLGIRAFLDNSRTPSSFSLYHISFSLHCTALHLEQESFV